MKKLVVIRSLILILFLITVMGSNIEEKNTIKPVIKDVKKKVYESGHNLNLSSFKKVHFITIFQYLLLKESLTGRQVCHWWNKKITEYLNHLIAKLLDEFNPQAFFLYPVLINPKIDAVYLPTKKITTQDQNLANTKQIGYYLEVIAWYEKYLATETHKFAQDFKTVLRRILNRVNPRKYHTPFSYFPRTKQKLQYNRKQKCFVNIWGSKWHNVALPLIIKTIHFEENQHKEIWWSLFGAHHTDCGDFSFLELTLQKNYQGMEGTCDIWYYREAKYFRVASIKRHDKVFPVTQFKTILSILDL